MLKNWKPTKTILAAAAAITAITGFTGAAYAMRDPAYAAARANGQVGEKMDGYLGVVGEETPELRRMVSNINIQRRAVYTEKALAANAQLLEYAFTSGCLLIARTAPGEMYQAYSTGGWKKREASAPDRDPRCP